MGEVINLNKARKAKVRDDRSRQAAENRIRFGQTKIERVKAKSEAEKTLKDHKGKELD